MSPVPEPPHPRPIIGLSACLGGEDVRYDGSNRRDDALLEALAGFADLHLICPEVSIGMGVPRPPIQLSIIDHAIRVRRVDDPALDVTDRLLAWAEDRLPLLRGLDGYVFKSGSPSCGIHGVRRVHADGHEDWEGSGYFAGFVRERLPRLPLADEESLADAGERRAFEQRVMRHFRRRTGGLDDERGA